MHSIMRLKNEGLRYGKKDRSDVVSIASSRKSAERI